MGKTASSKTFRPHSHRTQRCSQMLHAKNGTHCCQLECSHSIANNCKQHQRVCKQICVQMCFRVLCELGLRLAASKNSRGWENNFDRNPALQCTVIATHSHQMRRRRNVTASQCSDWLLAKTTELGRTTPPSPPDATVTACPSHQMRANPDST